MLCGAASFICTSALARIRSLMACSRRRLSLLPARISRAAASVQIAWPSSDRYRLREKITMAQSISAMTAIVIGTAGSHRKPRHTPSAHKARLRMTAAAKCIARRRCALLRSAMAVLFVRRMASFIA